MLRLKGAPFCTAFTVYRDHDPSGQNEETGIWLDIAADGADVSWITLVDTGAPWCIVKATIADALGLTTHKEAGLSTRLGVVLGELHRVPVMLLADEGRPLTVDATVFASAHWTGPNVLGYQGFLERLRFAVDPATRRFHFGKL